MQQRFPNLIGIFIILFLVTTICSANVRVSPPELSITMIEEFIQGNTTKKITIFNDHNTTVNVSWYKEHPNPIEWMRPNRTCIPNISWIDVKPIWKNVSGNSNTSFYIYLEIPDEKANYNQSWESWITFKLGQQGFASYESAVRLYIDTPLYTSINNSNQQDNSSKDPSSTNEAVVAVFLITAFSVLLLLRKKKQSP